jgi:hypothetical protein
VTNERPPPLFTYFWQVVTSLTCALVVALWVWVWNTSIALRDISELNTTILNHDLRISVNKASIDLNDQEIALLKVNLQYMQDDRESFKLALRDMQTEYKQFNNVHQEIIVSLTRLNETVIQIKEQLRLSNRNLLEDEGPIRGR